jgi:hypothetical protein
MVPDTHPYAIITTTRNQRIIVNLNSEDQFELPLSSLRELISAQPRALNTIMSENTEEEENMKKNILETHQIWRQKERKLGTITDQKNSQTTHYKGHRRSRHTHTHANRKTEPIK